MWKKTFTVDLCRHPFISLIPDKEKEGSTKFIENIVWSTTSTTPLNSPMEFSTQPPSPQAAIQLERFNRTLYLKGKNILL